MRVARADGAFPASGRLGLALVVADAFALGAAEAERLVSRADALDRETDDLSGLVDRLGHSLDAAGRRRLVALAFRVAAGDGGVGEIKGDLVWRLGHLLGVSEADLSGLRTAAVQHSERG